MNDDDYVYVEGSPTHFEEEEKKLDPYIGLKNDLSDDNSFLSSSDEEGEFKYWLLNPIWIEGGSEAIPWVK